MTFLLSCCQSTLNSTIRYMCWKSRSVPKSPSSIQFYKLQGICPSTVYKDSNTHCNNFYAKNMRINKKLMAGQERGLLVITGERPWCSVAKQPHVHLPRIWSKSHKRNAKSNICRCGLCRGWNWKTNTNLLIFENRAPCGSVVKYVSGQQGVDIMENSGRGIWKYSFICKFMDFFQTKLRTWTKEYLLSNMYIPT